MGTTSKTVGQITEGNHRHLKKQDGGSNNKGSTSKTVGQITRHPKKQDGGSNNGREPSAPQEARRWVK